MGSFSEPKSHLVGRLNRSSGDERGRKANESGVPGARKLSQGKSDQLSVFPIYLFFCSFFRTIGSCF